MITITSHRVEDSSGKLLNDLNNKIQIAAVDEQGSGGRTICTSFKRCLRGWPGVPYTDGVPPHRAGQADPDRT